jgi:hypothetical protein
MMVFDVVYQTPPLCCLYSACSSRTKHWLCLPKYLKKEIRILELILRVINYIYILVITFCSHEL